MELKKRTELAKSLTFQFLEIVVSSKIKTNQGNVNALVIPLVEDSLSTIPKQLGERLKIDSGNVCPKNAFL